ncbi:MAG TPA: AAA family ATPase, partial [Myxococcota bacterium]|nr:AAA family ATPase [Myxococcota bacterium]
PLTLLAGANSAGKSSIMQALLLIKQTQEATHDPGGLLLDGPCVHAKSAEALLWNGGDKKKKAEIWSIELDYGPDRVVQVDYQRQPTGGFVPLRTRERTERGELVLEEGFYPAEVWRRDQPGHEFWVQLLAPGKEVAVARSRTSHRLVFSSGLGEIAPDRLFPDDFGSDIIHLPGLRGNPERAYLKSRSTAPFPGTFQSYAASVLLGWQEQKDPRAAEVADHLVRLGLTWKVEARRVSQSDTEVELRVGRLPKAQKGGAKDLVNIADVGFGVSQVLPVVVGLLAGEPGQIVHIEQPELHLHPRAQVAMAGLLVQAAKRGVLVVVETHAPLLLMAIQLAVAKGDIPAADVSLNWFSRDEEGATQIREGHMDAAGAYEDWPVDFATVERDLMRAYIHAAMGDQ